jgi:hypothetical protein
MFALLGVAGVGVGIASPTAAAIPLDGIETDPIVEEQATEWIQGSMETHYGPVFNNGAGGTGIVLKSDVWYTNRFGTRTPPTVGEKWVGVAHVGVYDPNPGSTAVEFVVTPPPNTTFAIDSNDKIHCGYIPQGGGTTFDDVTKDPAANCPSAPTQTPEGWSLGTRQLPKGTQFAIDFPLRSSAPLQGASGPNGGDKLRVSVRPQFAETKEPYVDVNVSQPTPPRPIRDVLGSLVTCVWDNPNNPGPC